MAKNYIPGGSVFDASIHRMRRLYREGHRIIVALSGGKDSGICLEICRLSAELEGCLPVEVMCRDEEIVVPGTNEYLDYIYKQKKNYKFDLLIARQPVINIFNRREPYWWVYDQLLPPEKWMRTPPSYATFIKEKNIDALVIPGRYPPPKGKLLIEVMGLRASESVNRNLAIHTTKDAYLTKTHPNGVNKCYPIYDWTDTDIWKAYHDNKWRYNTIYDVMYRGGISPRDLRVGPPTMTVAGLKTLVVVANAYPSWFDKVCKRVPGMRTAIHFGKRVCEPYRRLGETWQECFMRECIETAPGWIAERSKLAMSKLLLAHSRHSTFDFPEIHGCPKCIGYGANSWKKLAKGMYMGDPFGLKVKHVLGYVEPDFFRPGSGKWGGKATW